MGTKHPARRCVLTGVLDLSFNEIGEGGARALAASLSQPVCALLELNDHVLLNAVVQKSSEEQPRAAKSSGEWDNQSRIVHQTLTCDRCRISSNDVSAQIRGRGQCQRGRESGVRLRPESDQAAALQGCM